MDSFACLFSRTTFTAMAFVAMHSLSGGCAQGPSEAEALDAGRGLAAEPASTAPESEPGVVAPEAAPEETPPAIEPEDTSAPEETPPEPSSAPESEPAPSPETSEPEPVVSAGCGTSIPDDGEWTVQVDGQSRTFHVHLPATYDPGVATPVVLSFHGHAISANLQAVVDRFRTVADNEGFIAVHPQGLGTRPSWNGGACCGHSKDNAIDDVAFVDAMLDELQGRLCVDTRRIYAGGLSNGGFLAYRLACERADRLAAVASVAGVTGVLGCSPSRPIPVQHFHGTSDLIVPYNGNFAIAYLSVDSHIAQWRDHNGCAAPSRVSFEEDDVTCEIWEACAGLSEVELCTVDEGGHQWPGGWEIPGLGRNTDTIDASTRMWEFFQRHRLP